MERRVIKRILLWIVIPLIVWTILVFAIFPTERPEHFSEEPYNIVGGLYDAIRTGILIGAYLCHIGILGFYIWYDERKKKKSA